MLFGFTRLSVSSKGYFAFNTDRISLASNLASRTLQKRVSQVKTATKLVDGILVKIYLTIDGRKSIDQFKPTSVVHIGGYVMKSGVTQRLNVSKCFWSVSNGFLYALDISQCFWLIWSCPKSYCVGRLESLGS